MAVVSPLFIVFKKLLENSQVKFFDLLDLDFFAPLLLYERLCLDRFVFCEVLLGFE